MRTVTVRTELAAPVDCVWQALKTPHAFVHVARPLLRYPAAERLDRPWQAGDRLVGWTFLWGVVPFSRHHLAIESIDDDARTLVSSEHGGLIRTWRHQLLATPIDDTSCEYEDRIDIEAGVFTRIVAAYAAVFFRHRQRRLRSLVRLLSATAASI